MCEATASAFCPGPVAIIEGISLNAIVIPRLEALYQQLGCQLKVETYPGRRGVVAFNANEVSGELFRQHAIETAYKIEFIRSEWPVLSVQEGVWTRPDTSVKESSKIGYLLGLKWQENYARSNEATENFFPYANPSELWLDYNRGYLDGFLANNVLIDALLDEGTISEKPEFGTLVSNSKLFHYLSAEFSPFMDEFSRELKVQGTGQ